MEVGPLHLSVVRGPDSEGRWYWRARDAARETVWTGWATRQEALREARTQAGLAEPPLELRTLGELLHAWAAARREDPTLSEVTQENYTQGVAHPMRLLGALPLGQVKLPALEGYRNTRLGEGAAPRTVAAELRLVRIAWRWALRREHLTGAPLPSVPLKVRGYVLNHRTPTEAEVRAVLARIHDPSARLAVQILASTGARIGEVLALRLRDIDLSAGLLHLHGKSGARTLPLTPGLRRLLAPRVGRGAGRLLRVSARTVRATLATACEAAQVPVFTPHGLRRLVVTRLCRAGIDPALAAAVTGHSVEVMLTAYRTVDPEETARGVRQAGLGQRLSSAARGGQGRALAQNGAQVAKAGL